MKTSLKSGTSVLLSERINIVLLGERNSGKSSLMNAIAGFDVAIVSDVPGTTTDRVSKALEIPGIGACLLVDTAGIDDSGELGGKRVAGSADALRSADVVLAVIDAGTGRLPELPLDVVSLVPVVNKSELLPDDDLKVFAQKVKDKYGKPAVFVSAKLKQGISNLVEALRNAVPDDAGALPLTAGVVEEGDLAVLVMPQDKEAPKGRLILPQQQTLRELLEKRCRIMCCTPDSLAASLESLTESPAVIITDSQAFPLVKPLVPKGTKLTSFSMLLAASKGDMGFFRESAGKLDSLTPASRVLIAEACTHVPLSEDIGRVKIPAMLRHRVGESLNIDFVSGRDFPEDLSRYDLVVHCGACMFSRRYVMSRVEQAKRQGVPMTNYGVLLELLCSMTK